MTKNIKNFTITMIIAFVLSLFLPWWSVMLAGFTSSFLIPLKKLAVFFIPMIAVMSLWILQSLLLSGANNFILAKKIAVLLMLSGNITSLILFTGVIGGLATGISAVLGKQTNALFK